MPEDCKVENQLEWHTTTCLKDFISKSGSGKEEGVIAQPLNKCFLYQYINRNIDTTLLTSE